MKSPLISGNRTVEDVLREHLKEQRDAATGPPRTGRNPSPPGTPPAPSPGIVPAVTSLADYIKLENISCVDAEGHEFERYGELYVAKDIVRNPDNSHISKTPYQWAVYFEPQGLFLPSFALSCAIVAALYQQKGNQEVEKVLHHYKNKGNGTGWHAQNTIVDYASEQIVHYPVAADVAQSADVNASKPRKALSFSKATLQDSVLADALRNPTSAHYVKQLTGLRDPSILVDIGNYFGKPAKLWFPWNGQQGSTCTEKRAAWLGCDVDYFDLSAYDNLNSTDAARGVRLGAPAGRAAPPGGSTP